MAIHRLAAVKPKPKPSPIKEVLTARELKKK